MTGSAQLRDPGCSGTSTCGPGVLASFGVCTNHLLRKGIWGRVMSLPKLAPGQGACAPSLLGLFPPPLLGPSSGPAPQTGACRQIRVSLAHPAALTPEGASSPVGVNMTSMRSVATVGQRSGSRPVTQNLLGLTVGWMMASGPSTNTEDAEARRARACGGNGSSSMFWGGWVQSLCSSQHPGCSQFSGLTTPLQTPGLLHVPCHCLESPSQTSPPTLLSLLVLYKFLAQSHCLWEGPHHTWLGLRAPGPFQGPHPPPFGDPESEDC